MRLIFNPFERIAGYTALIAGLAIIVLIAYLSTFSDIVTDTVIGFHFFKGFDFGKNILVGGINLISAGVFLYISGLIASRSRIRVVDVFGTMALSRFPYLIVVLLAFLVPVEKVFTFLKESLTAVNFGIFTINELIYLIIFSIIGIFCLIWSIALMYNAYRVSCNLQGNRAIISFVIALIVAEIVSLVLFTILVFNQFESL